MKKLRASIILSYVLILCAILLSSCSGTTPTPQFTSTKTSTIVPLEISSATATPRDKQIIEPDNVNKLQVLEKWGKGDVYGVALSPDETGIALSTATGIYIYDYETLQVKQFIDLSFMQNVDRNHYPNRAISYSPDGNFLALGFDDVIIWDLSENKILNHFGNQITDFDIIQIAYSPRGDTMVVISMGGYSPCDAWGGNFALYNVESGDLLYNDFFCPESALFHFSFLDNGNVAFVGIARDSTYWGYQVSIVNATTGILIEKLSNEGYIDSISPDGSMMATREYNSISTEIIDVDTQNIIENIDGIVIFLPNDNRRLVESKNDWKVTTSNNIDICDFENKPNIDLEVYRTPFTIKGDKLIFWDDWYQNVEIWDLSQCKLVKQLFLPSGWDSLKYSADGNYLATHSLSNVHLFDGKNGEYIFSIPGKYNAKPAQYNDFSVDSNTLVVVSNDNPYTLSFWDSNSGKETLTIPTKFNYIEHVSISPDEKFVATVDYDGIHLWDVKNRSLLYTISGRFGNVFWNPNRSNFALIDGSDIVFRNIKNGDIEKRITIPKERFDVVFSKDWVYMAIFYGEKIELWDMNGNKVRDLLNDSATTQTDTSSPIYIFLFSPDNNLLVSVRSDKNNYNVRFWDTQTGEILRDMAVPLGITEIEFSPDGKRLSLLGNGIIYSIGVKMP